MSLSSTSNTINALGIFGRLEPKQEEYFKELENKYSKYPEDDSAIEIFKHLSLVINNDVAIGKMPDYIDLLRELKPYLPFKISVSGVIIRDEKHLALSFDTNQTQEIRDIASKFVPQGIVTTFFTKVVWFVPKEKQNEAIEELKGIKEMVFGDFILVANSQDDANTIYSSNRYK